MRRLLRLARIFWIGLRFGLHDLGADSRRRVPRAVRIRQALETLGPIFVKFGQILSTRRDLLPLDVADELARLQDRVPPFAPELAVVVTSRERLALAAEHVTEVGPLGSEGLALLVAAARRAQSSFALRAGDHLAFAPETEVGGDRRKHSVQPDVVAVDRHEAEQRVRCRDKPEDHQHCVGHGDDLRVQTRREDPGERQNAQDPEQEVDQVV